MAAKQIDPLVATILGRDYEKMVSLLESGASPEQTDQSGNTCINVAGNTNQFRMVENLMDHGADIWFDYLGGTIAGAAYVSRLKPESEEGRALARVVLRLKKAGYSWPPPTPQEVEKLKKENRWPPANAKDVFGKAIPRR
jgi:hypothetical protein